MRNDGIQLDRRIALVATKYTGDGSSLPLKNVTTWVWARREELGSDHRDRAMYTIRYRPGVTTAWHVEAGGKCYDIQEIEFIGRNRYLKLTVKEIG